MKLLKNAGAMSIAVLLSRFLGLIREQVFAFLFGAGLYSDASLIAYRIPNLLRDLLAEGALSSAFVSVFAKEKSLDEQQHLHRRMNGLLLFILIVITLIILFGSYWIVDLMAGAFKSIPGKFELTTELTQMLSPFLLFASLGALSMGILNSLGMYFLPSLGAAAFNLSNILIGGLGGVLLLRNGYSLREAATLFAVATLFGGFLTWAIQWRALKKKGFDPFAGFSQAVRPAKLRESFRNPKIRRIFLMIAPAAISVGALQINLFVNMGLASSLEQGSVTWLNYAYRLMHFPMGVFGVSLFMAALPRLSSTSNDPQLFSATLREAFGLSMFVSVGSAVGLMVFAEPLMAILFEHGRFNSVDVVQSARALQAYSVGLLAFNLNKILGSAFFALESVWTPATLSIVSIVANYFFSSYFSEMYGHSGIALSVSITSFLNTFLLIIFLRRKDIRISGLWFLKILLGTLISLTPMMAFYYWGGSDWLVNLSRTNFIAAGLAALGIMTLLGMSFLLLSLLFLEEGKKFYQTVIKSRLKRKAS